MIPYDQGSGEKGGMTEDRADLEKLIALAASEVAQKQSNAGVEVASQIRMAAGGSSQL